VLLYVAASVFRSYSPARILEALRRKGISTDDAVLCALSEDRGVSDRERLALDEFARLLARGGA
jgi:SOS response regulatory protein OraA/RecX